MKIANDTVVVFDFELRDDEGNLIDEGRGDEAMSYLHGHGQLVPGLERSLEGREEGENITISVAPADGYGEKDATELVRVPREVFGDDADALQVGEEVMAVGDDGEEQIFWVTKIETDTILVSSDHPLAGVTLNFDVTIRKVRPATEEELEHGHAHEGPAGHEH